MEIEKKDGPSFSENDCIVFPEGLFGFEEYKKYLPLSVEDDSDVVLYLQSTEEEGLSFIIMNPFLLKEDYCPEISGKDREALGTEREEDLSYYVLCVVKEPAEASTVNLKCPVVVNAKTRQARQVVLESEEYGFRHTLKELADRRRNSC